MNFVKFQDKLYVFGGYHKSKRLNDFHVFNTKTNKWKEIDTSNEQKIFKPIFSASTTIVPSSRRNFKCSVYVIAGMTNMGKMCANKNIMEIELEDIALRV